MRILLRQRLKQKQTESNLAQSIQAKNPTIKGGVVSMAIDLNDYWMFVDLGVKGLKNVSAAGVQTKTYTNKDFPQGFSFRNMGTPPQMISNLQDYIARKGIQVRVSKNQSGAEVIRDSFTMAKSMADAIKKKGIDGTQFYSDTFNQESYNELTNKLSTIIGQEVEFKLITEFKK